MKTEYESLNPRGLRGWMRRNRLYLVGDHLLLVRFDGFTEEYRRFYLRDIQGFVVRQTPRRGWYSALLAAFALGLGLPAAIPDVDTAARIVFGILAAFPFLALVLNLFAGPTCRTSIQTAVQTLDLPVLTRVSDYDLALTRIAPLIETAQAGLTSAASFRVTETTPPPAATDDLGPEILAPPAET